MGKICKRPRRNGSKTGTAASNGHLVAVFLMEILSRSMPLKLRKKRVLPVQVSVMNTTVALIHLFERLLLFEKFKVRRCITESCNL